MNRQAKNSDRGKEEKKFGLLLDYWVRHNREHGSELEIWRARLEEGGWNAAAREVEKAIAAAGQMDRHLETARKKISDREMKESKSPPRPAEEVSRDFNLRKIGTIHTPYRSVAPYQPRENDEGEFVIEVEPAYAAGLDRLEEFRYIYVLYYLHQRRGPISLKVQSPWSDEEVGLFASRSSRRPNPLGLSVVRLEEKRGNKLFTSGLDVFDATPLLDLKPYLQELDVKPDADYGWLTSEKGREHLLLHIKGIPH